MGQSRVFRADRRYLNLPVKDGAPPRRLSLWAEGRKVREFDIELARERPDFWVFSDVSGLAGRELTLAVEGDEPDPGLLNAVEPSDAIREHESVYREDLRPRFHFSSRRGWLNDPNGLVFHAGEYHLFYQHNPYGCRWGNMHWGHAVSLDLLGWRELPDALTPDETGTVFSGSAVVDRGNTSGFGSAGEDPLICVYTAAGGTAEWSKGRPFAQSIAWSLDRGRTWTKHGGNPVLPHAVGGNRDPKVFRHAPTDRWVMALYLDGNDYALFGSPDLKRWTRLSDLRLPGASECPDLFELPVDGDPGNTRWVFWGGNGSYVIGRFDGVTFRPETGVLRAERGANGYAAQTFSDIPPEDGRRIQISWMKGGEYPGMPFNGQMSAPVELTLRACPEGIRLCRTPVRELERLRFGSREWTGMAIEPGRELRADVESAGFEVRARIQPGDAAGFGIRLRGVDVRYRPADRTLSCLGKSATLEPVNGCVDLHALVDRTSLELFGNDGRISMSFCFLPDPDRPALEIRSDGGGVGVQSLVLHQLRSIW